jgi:integrase
MASVPLPYVFIKNFLLLGDFMASYEQDKKTKKWSVRYRVTIMGKPHQKRLSGFARKFDAQQAYYAEIGKIKAAEKSTAMTLNELFLLYKDFISNRLKSSSIKSACDVARLYILPYLGEKHIDKLTTNDVAQWQIEINKLGFSFKYKTRIYGSLTAMLNHAIKFYGLQSNVATLVGNFANTEPKKEMLYWTEDEFKQFIAVVDDLQWRVFFSFLYLTGCRKGEALALTWEDINLSTKMVHIAKSINRQGLNGKASYEVTTPKNKSSYRDILIPSSLQALLWEYYDYCQDLDGFNKKWFVFGIDRPFTEQTVRRRMDGYADKAGVKHIRVHDLRHSHASLLINKGQNILIVAQRLGHSDVKQTLNTYAHLMPSAQQQIINAINFDIKGCCNTPTSHDSGGGDKSPTK